MTAEKQDRDGGRGPGDPQDAAGQRLFSDQREANQNLVLATIQAQEATDRAEAALASAEATTRELQESERKLRAMGEFREQFLGIVGHDLRNPLSAISMSAQLLAGHGQLDEEDARLVALVLKSVGRMDRMIGLLLEFTRARLGGGLSLERGPANLREICASAVGELALLSAAPILCEFQGDMTGLWDGERLVQVLSNIVGNAVGFAAPGTPILVKARGDGAEIVVQISNQGDVIPADLLPVIFLPFHQGRQSETARAGHLGLGLYIAHEIMISHGGTLDARSSAGTTTFTMRLPRLPVVVHPAAAG